MTGMGIVCWGHFVSADLFLINGRRAKENQGARGAGQPFGILKMTGNGMVCWGYFVSAGLFLINERRAKEIQDVSLIGNIFDFRITA